MQGGVHVKDGCIWLKRSPHPVLYFTVKVIHLVEGGEVLKDRVHLTEGGSSYSAHCTSLSRMVCIWLQGGVPHIQDGVHLVEVGEVLKGYPHPGPCMAVQDRVHLAGRGASLSCAVKDGVHLV